ncbi:MAG: hypothetical protein AAF525_18015 [Pseudomonadota bacterium]
MFVGDRQGSLSARVLETLIVLDQIPRYEEGERREGQFKTSAETHLDGIISSFGYQLRDHGIVHHIPSPWYGREAVFSILQRAVQYRLDNPREYQYGSEEHAEQMEAYFQAQLNTLSDEQKEQIDQGAIDRAMEQLWQQADHEDAYQTALSYGRAHNAKDP